MEKEEINFLNQLVSSLEEAEKELEESYRKKDLEKFSKTKKFIMDVQIKIGEIVNGI
jgi:hypothetical protein